MAHYSLSMTDRARELLDAALTLSTEERAKMASELIASLDAPPDARSRSEWLAEVEQRARAALSGDDPGEDWPSLIFELRQELGGKP
jgi:hypothetical protein